MDWIYIAVVEIQGFCCMLQVFWIISAAEDLRLCWNIIWMMLIFVIFCVKNTFHLIPTCFYTLAAKNPVTNVKKNINNENNLQFSLGWRQKWCSDLTSGLINKILQNQAPPSAVINHTVIMGSSFFHIQKAVWLQQQTHHII